MNRGERRKRTFDKIINRIKQAKQIYRRWYENDPDNFNESARKHLKDKQWNYKRRYKREKDLQNWERNANADLPQKDEI